MNNPEKKELPAYDPFCEMPEDGGASSGQGIVLPSTGPEFITERQLDRRKSLQDAYEKLHTNGKI